MKKKNIIIISLVIVGLIAIIIASILYANRNSANPQVVCTYKNDEHHYTEKMVFQFVDNELYDFTRTEKTVAETTKDAKTLFDYYETKVEELSDYQSDYFIYQAKIEDTTINVKTYIKVLVYSSVFDKYLKDLSINSKSTSDEIIKALGSTYSCKIEKK